MNALRVGRWIEMYEVNDKNQPWRVGDKKRSWPLAYVRCRVEGGSWSLRFRDFLEKAGKSAAACFGVFIKATEFAADQRADRRGWLLDEQGKPLDAEAFAQETGFATTDVQKAFDVLTDPAVGWLEWAEFCEDGTPSQELPGTPGTPGTPEIPYQHRHNTDTDTKGNQAGDKPPCPPFDAILAAYNGVCPAAGLPEAHLTTARKRHLRARWKEALFRERYGDIFAKAAASGFCCGANDRGWTADFSWLIANSENYTKVLEGKYDDRGGSGEPADTAKDRLAGEMAGEMEP